MVLLHVIFSASRFSPLSRRGLVHNSISTTFSGLNESCHDHSHEEGGKTERNPTDVNLYCHRGDHHFSFTE
jgi:hypothetical protein